MYRWRLQDAKNRFLEIVRKALEQGPQVIALHGNDATVVIAIEEYERLKKHSGGTLAEFFQLSPLAGMELNLTRRRDAGRKIKL